MELQEVPRLKNSDKQSLTKALASSQPWVVEDWANSWQAIFKWDLAYLNKTIGPQKVKVYDSTFALPGRDYMKNVRLMPFTEFTHHLHSGPTDLRLFVYNLSRHAPQLLDDLVLPKGFSPHAPYLLSKAVFLFAGGEKAITKLHFDVDLSYVFHTVIWGAKKFYLFPPEQRRNLYHQPFTFRGPVDPANPNYQRWPQLSKAKGFQVVLKKGETLLIPSGYWHHVVYEKSSLGVSLRYQHGDLGVRLRGYRNLLVVNPLDRLANKLAPLAWHHWKVRKAQQLAEHT